MRATLLCLAQGLEAARVCAFAARISTFASTTLKRLLATILCGAVMADGVATIQSIRPNGARSGLSDAGPFEKLIFDDVAFEKLK